MAADLERLWHALTEAWDTFWFVWENHEELKKPWIGAAIEKCRTIIKTDEEEEARRRDKN